MLVTGTGTTPCLKIDEKLISPWQRKGMDAVLQCLEGVEPCGVSVRRSGNFWASAQFQTAQPLVVMLSQRVAPAAASVSRVPWTFRCSM